MPASGTAARKNTKILAEQSALYPSQLSDTRPHGQTATPVLVQPKKIGAVLPTGRRGNSCSENLTIGYSVRDASVWAVATPLVGISGAVTVAVPTNSALAHVICGLGNSSLRSR